MKVVPLVTFNAEAQKEVVDTLSELLERAKGGEFTSFAWTATLPSGDVKTGFTKSPDRHGQISGAAILQYRLIVAAQNSSEEKSCQV